MIDQIKTIAGGLWDAIMGESNSGGGTYSHVPKGPKAAEITPTSLALPKGTQGGGFTAAVDAAQEAKQQAEVHRKLSEAEEAVLKEYDIDPRVVKNNLMDVYQRIGAMESNNRNDVSPGTSSAKGYFQYVDGSFEAAKNRVERFYKNKLKKDPPAYLKNDTITDLTRAQQEELMLIDWRMGPRSYMGDLKNYLVQGRTADGVKSLHNIYGNHHTGIDKDPNAETIRRRMGKLL